MKQFFEDLFKPDENGVTNAYGDNPSTLSLAGLMAATSGKRLGDVMTDAAAVNRDREMTKLNKLKHEQEVNKLLNQQKLAQWMLENPNATNQEFTQKSLEFGLPPANIAGLGSFAGTETKVVQDPFTGKPKVLTLRGGQVNNISSLEDALAGNGNEMPVYLNPTQSANTHGEVTTQKLPELTGNNTQHLPEKSKDRKTNFKEFAKAYVPEKPNQASYKGKEAYDLANHKDYLKYKNDIIQPSLRNARDVKHSLENIIKANEKFKTGTPAEKILAAKSLGTYLGLNNAEEVGSAELLRGASSKLITDLAEKVKPVSKSDLDFLQLAVPSLINSPEGNKKLARYFEQLNERSREYLKRAEDYYKDYRTLEGFESAWDDFVEQNPLFSKGPDVSPIKKTYSLKRIAAADARREAKRQAGMQ